MREKLFDPRRPAPAAGVKPLHDKSATDRSLLDIEAVDIELVIVLGIGDRRLQHLFDIASDAPMGKGKFRQRRGGTFATNRLGNEVELARAGAQTAQTGLRLGLFEAARRGGFTHLLSLSSPACRQRGRRRSGSEQTRRACARSCSRSRAPE